MPCYSTIQRPPRLTLVEDGKELGRSMSKANITHDELMSAIRGHGLMDLERVQRAYLEPNGLVSVITTEEKPTETAPRKTIF